MSTRLPQTFMVMLCSTVVLAWAGPAAAITELDLGSGPNNPSMDPFHLKMGRERESVGAIRTYEADDGVLTPLALGSSNAIRGHWVLTAAHVVVGADALDVQMGKAFDLPGNGNFSASDWYVPNTYDGNIISESDVALVNIREDGDGDAISPDHLTQFNHDTSRPLLGKEYTTAGFGTYGTGESGNIFFDGQKRAGKNIYDSRLGLFSSILLSDFDIDPSPRDFYGDRYRPGIYFDPQPPDDFRIAYEASNAQGDSGGGQYRSGQLTSVTSFTTVGSPFGAINGNVDVSRWANWIETVIHDPDAAESNGLAVRGSPFNPIEIDLEEPDDSGDDALGALHAQQQYYAGLFQDYFNPNAPVGLNESLQMLGLAKRSDDEATPQELVDLLGLDLGPDATDQEIDAAARQELTRLLDQSFGNEQFARMINAGYGDSKTAYSAGLADLDDLQKEFDDLDFFGGDANRDDRVDLEDLELLAEYWKQSGREWSEGDFSFDTLVDEEDLQTLEDNWLTTADGDEIDGPSFQEALAEVNIPEPSTVAVLGLAGLPLLLRRRTLGR